MSVSTIRYSISNDLGIESKISNQQLVVGTEAQHLHVIGSENLNRGFMLADLIRQ